MLIEHPLPPRLEIHTGRLKPTYLKDHGHEVLNPHLPDDDFDAAIRIAQAEFDQHKPDVVVGSSRGGAVAMNIDSGDTPLVLLCPAWKTWGTATTVKPNTIILHSRADETVPFADSEELVKNSGVPTESLIEVGFEHRLADEESLEAMLRAVEGIKIQQELPVWIERFLMRGSYSCSEPEYVQFRQDRLRKSVLEIADAHENGRKLLHDACVEHLGDSNEDVVRNALSCLFVLGTTTDVASVEPLLQHSTEDIRKAARTCLFEIKRRPAED